MKSELEDLPRYSSADSTVVAARFNQVRLALLRLESAIRFAIPGLRHLDMILDHETWICVDNSLNDLPVLAWTEFETEYRTSLHEPIPCRFYTYNANATVIVDRVLQAIDDHIDRKLHPHGDRH